MIVFIGYFSYWRIYTIKLAKHTESKNYTIGDYALYVSNFPKNTKNKDKVTKEKLKLFFQDFGKVVECIPVKNFGG